MIFERALSCILHRALRKGTYPRASSPMRPRDRQTFNIFLIHHPYFEMDRHPFVLQRTFVLSHYIVHYSVFSYMVS